ncbi:TlpA family protein disulfide reductase [bacterium]|nr:MAG: TlpA family protein disulfide reductase [bacterium]
MKIQLLVLPMLGILSSAMQAQTPTPPTTPNSTIEPAAATLLNEAIATYKDTSRLSFRFSTTINGKLGPISTVRLALPDKVTLEQTEGKTTRRFLLTGSDLYIVEGTSYRKQAAPPISGPRLLEGMSAVVSSFLASLLDGKNPITASQSIYAQAPYQGFQGRTVALAPRVIDGDVLRGVQSTYSYKFVGRDGKANPMRNQTTAWFGGSPPTLRRVQSILTQGGKNITFSEKILEQDINPNYSAEIFQFNDSGLKLVAEQEEQYFDPKLKTGATPFAFTAKGLDGATITPAKYKGKVLLLDFWATWCGPCVASLPELKGAYDKYHAQGLEVVGISLDEDKNALTSFIKTRKMPWAQIYDGKGWKSAVPGVYGVKAIPFMLIIGKDGKIASVNPRGKIDDAVKAALAAG